MPGAQAAFHKLASQARGYSVACECITHLLFCSHSPHRLSFEIGTLTTVRILLTGTEERSFTSSLVAFPLLGDGVATSVS